MTRSFGKQFQNQKHTDVRAEDEEEGVTHYLYTNPTYPKKKGLRSPYKEDLHDHIGNEDIHDMQARDDEKKDHTNRKTYKDMLVKDLEKVPNKDGSRWRRKNPESRQNEEVEFSQCSPASTFLMNPHESGHFQHDRHVNDTPQIQHSPQNHNDDQLHDEQVGHPQNRLGHDQNDLQHDPHQIGHHQLGHHQIGHQQHQIGHHQLGHQQHQIGHHPVSHQQPQLGHQQHQIGHHPLSHQEPQLSHHQHGHRQHDQ